MKLKVNQKVKVFPNGTYNGGEGFIYKLDRYARTYSVSTDEGKFFEFHENEIGKTFEPIE